MKATAAPSIVDHQHHRPSRYEALDHNRSDRDLYAHWDPADMFIRTQRRRAAAALLHQAGVFPNAGDACLEIGYGRLGWLGELINWGVRASDLHGMELDGARAKVAQELLPTADLLVGDAMALPWDDESFQLVITSTVLTSILDDAVQQRVADEATRVLAPGGALLWWDFAVNSPNNPRVRGVNRRRLRQLFPGLQGRIQSVTLAPPITRAVVPWSWPLALLLESVPLLRTHLIAVLQKPSRDRRDQGTNS